MGSRKGWEDGQERGVRRSGGRGSGAALGAEEVANSSPAPWSEAQATDFDQNKTALTRAHYSKTSVELTGGQPPAWVSARDTSVGGGQGPAEGGVSMALARTERVERRSEDFFFNPGNFTTDKSNRILNLVQTCQHQTPDFVLEPPLSTQYASAGAPRPSSGDRPFQLTPFLGSLIIPWRLSENGDNFSREAP